MFTTNFLISFLERPIPHLHVSVSVFILLVHQPYLIVVPDKIKFLVDLANFGNGHGFLPRLKVYLE